jgi:hypothetical protein
MKESDVNADVQVLTGGCHCGAVRYKARAAPYHRTLCHCTDCRGTSGAPAVGWFSVPPAALQWLRGAPRHYRSSAKATRCFCGACGTQLTYQRDELGEIDITLASLDDAASVAPADHTFARSELPWMRGLDGLPRHATTRPQA